VIAVTAPGKGFWTPNGRHRLESGLSRPLDGNRDELAPIRIPSEASNAGAKARRSRSATNFLLKHLRFRARLW